MVKFLFGLFIVSRIIKIFNLLRGKDISNVDENIEKVEYVYKFSGFNYDAFAKNFVLIAELIVIAIILATVNLFTHPISLLIVPAILLIFEIYTIIEFISAKTILQYLEHCKNISKWRLFFNLLIELIWAAMVVMLL